jgi:hypothetical protein
MEPHPLLLLTGREWYLFGPGPSLLLSSSYPPTSDTSDTASKLHEICFLGQAEGWSSMCSCVVEMGDLVVVWPGVA